MQHVFTQLLTPHLFPRLLWGPLELCVTHIWTGQSSLALSLLASFQTPASLSMKSFSWTQETGNAFLLSASILFPFPASNFPSSRSWAHFINRLKPFLPVRSSSWKKERFRLLLATPTPCGAPSWGKVHTCAELISWLIKFQMKNIIMDTILESHKIDEYQSLTFKTSYLSCAAFHTSSLYWRHTLKQESSLS